MKNKTIILAMVLLQGCLYAKGLEAGTTFFQTIVDFFLGLVHLIATLALLWVGYKVMMTPTRFTEVAHIFVGALLVVLAPEFGTLIASITK